VTVLTPPSLSVVVYTTLVVVELDVTLLCVDDDSEFPPGVPVGGLVLDAEVGADVVGGGAWVELSLGVVSLDPDVGGGLLVEVGGVVAGGEVLVGGSVFDVVMVPFEFCRLTSSIKFGAGAALSW